MGRNSLKSGEPHRNRTCNLLIKSLANPYPRTPAMATGLTNHIWTVEEIVKLVK